MSKPMKFLSSIFFLIENFSKWNINNTLTKHTICRAIFGYVFKNVISILSLDCNKTWFLHTSCLSLLISPWGWNWNCFTVSSLYVLHPIFISEMETAFYNIFSVWTKKYRGYFSILLISISADYFLYWNKKRLR